MAAILREDPPEMDASLLAGLRQIIQHSLEKNRDLRFQNTRDLAFALRSFSGSGPNAALTVNPPLSRRTLLAAGAGAAALTGAAAYFAGTKSASPDPVRYQSRYPKYVTERSKH